MSFSPPVVGCLLKKRLTKGGHGHPSPSPPPPWLRPWCNNFRYTFKRGPRCSCFFTSYRGCFRMAVTANKSNNWKPIEGNSTVTEFTFELLYKLNKRSQKKSIVFKLSPLQTKREAILRRWGPLVCSPPPLPRARGSPSTCRNRNQSSLLLFSFASCPISKWYMLQN